MTRDELVEKMVVAAFHFRHTSLVDDDFPVVRNEFDNLLTKLELRDHDPLPSPTFAVDVERELKRAREKHPQGFKSAHEGYAVILEEVDEVWDDVKADRRGEKLRAELVQVAAMAQRMAEDLNL